MDNNDFLKSLTKSLLEATKSVMEAKPHTVPKTDKEKKLAALAEPKDKITHADVLKGRGVMKEAEVAGVAAGSMEGEKHMCATKVFHKEWKEGTPVKTMHADPDADGLIEWYDVMFDHGIERVMTEDMKILHQESHMHSKRKMKEDVEAIEELSTSMLKSYRKKAREDYWDADAVDDEPRARKRAAGSNLSGKKIIKQGGSLKTEEVEDLDESAKVAAHLIKRYGENVRKSHVRSAANDFGVGYVALSHAVRKKLGVNRLEEEQIDEAMNAADRFKHHHDHAKTLLKSISDHLKMEHESATKHTDYKGNKGPHWGHVGSMEHVANQLSNIHDMLARKGEYAESVEVEDEVTLTEAEIAALEQIAETADDLDEARGRPKLPRDAKGNIIRGGSTAKASVAKVEEEPLALGYQLRKAASINKPVHFMSGEKKEVTSKHIQAFNDHMGARKTSLEKAAFQAKAHKSHADFLKAVSEPVPHATKDTGEIVKYRH